MSKYQRNKKLAEYEARKFVRMFPDYIGLNEYCKLRYKALFTKVAKKYGLTRVFKELRLI